MRRLTSASHHTTARTGHIGMVRLYNIVLLCALAATPVFSQTDASSDVQPAEQSVQPAETPLSAPRNTPPLPKGFALPKERHPSFLITKELITEEEDERFRRNDFRKYRDAVKSKTLNEATRKLIEDGAKWQVHRMTLKKHRRQLHKHRADIDTFVKLNAKSSIVRRTLLAELAKRATELLDNNFYVRVNAVMLLSQLITEPEDKQRGIPAQPYTPAAAPLLQVLIDDVLVMPENVQVGDVFMLSGNGRAVSFTATEANAANVIAGLTSAWSEGAEEITARNNQSYVRFSASGLPVSLDASTEDGGGNSDQRLVVLQWQPEAVKIAATRGLKRICEVGNPENQLRLQIAEALVSELSRSGIHFWYQWTLTDGLGKAGVSYNLARRPFVVQALMKVLVDSEKHWIVRGEAARSLGRVPLDSNMNVDLILFSVVDLCQQMAHAYNERSQLFYWKDCFLKLYLSFQPQDESEENRRAGFKLQAIAQEKVQSCYNLVLPIVKHVLHSKGDKIGEEQLQSLAEWLNNNRPANSQVAPGLEPITDDPTVIEAQPVSATD